MVTSVLEALPEAEAVKAVDLGWKQKRKRLSQGRPFQIWLGGLAPGFSNYWGGGAKLPPKSQTLAGKILKIPTYLVLKGRNFFWPFLKPVFWTFHEGYPEKKFFQVKKLTFIAFLSYNFSKICSKIF